MRPLSVVSDLREVIAQACAEAAECGLEPDQIIEVVRDELALFAELEAVK
jgi:hypothetical protein